MKTISKWATALVLISGAAYGQVPASNDTSDPVQNTGMGTGALGGPAASNVGYYNTASGYQALYYNIGNDNTAAGYQALYYNSGSNNTASGYRALYYNTGNDNTAAGFEALFANTTGGYNSASGSRRSLATRLEASTPPPGSLRSP